LLGWLDQNDLMQVLQDSKLLIFPSQYYEAGGTITVMQALASGTPVIVADTYADAGNLLDAGVGWTFENGNPADLARVVELALSDQAKLFAMRERARNLFERAHTAQDNYVQLMRIYSDATDFRNRKNNSIAN
jgi:glycosyltransferase involved in cell wall biosynthesis